MGFMQTKVTINSIDVTSKLLNWKIEEVWGVSITKSTLQFTQSVNALVATSPGAEIVITRGTVTPTDETVFRGQVIQQKPEGPRIKLECKDRFIEAIKAEVTKSYDINVDPEAGVLSEIFKDLVNTFTDLTADGTTVTNSGVVDVLKKFVCRSEDVYEKLEELRDALNWQMTYDPVTDKVFFGPKGTTTFATPLVVGQNVSNTPKWLFNMEQLINEAKVFGATQEDTIIELQDGTGAKTVFTVARTPEITDVFVGGVKQDRGVTDSQLGDYEVDAELKTFTFIVAPALAVGNVNLTYTTKIPVPVVARNQTSIDTFGGENKTAHKKSFFFTEKLTVADAEAKAQEILDKYSTPFISTTLVLSQIIDVNIGDFVTVQDTLNNINQVLLVNKITREFPHKGDKIGVGDKEWRLEDWQIDVADRIQKLYNELNKNQEILLNIEQFFHTTKLRRRVLCVLKRNIAGTTMIWGNETFGIWGESNWGDVTTFAFILGSAKAGVLGTNLLGAGNQPSAIWDDADSKWGDVNTKWDTDADGFIKFFQADYVCP